MHTTIHILHRTVHSKCKGVSASSSEIWKKSLLTHPGRKHETESLGQKLPDVSVTNRNQSWLAELKIQLIYPGGPSYLQTVTLPDTKKLNFTLTSL